MEEEAASCHGFYWEASWVAEEDPGDTVAEVLEAEVASVVDSAALGVAVLAAAVRVEVIRGFDLIFLNN